MDRNSIRASGVVGRRRVLQAMVAGYAAAAIPRRGAPGATVTADASGTNWSLTVGELPVDIAGIPQRATAVDATVPGPLLRWRQGDTVSIAVTNRLAVPTSIHWHGVRTPTSMDGVPGLSFGGIAPGETFTYRFPVHQHGTYWYHGHSGFQEQMGLFGPIIIEPQDGYADRFDRDYVVMLSDWPRDDPGAILRNLKAQSDYYNYGQRTIVDFLSDLRQQGVGRTIADRHDWATMRMAPTDIADVSGAVYSYLLNGRPAAANWTGLFSPGEAVRLRFINASAMTFFDVAIPGLEMAVVQADGNDVLPVPVDLFRIGVAETYDVIVRPADRPYTIFAQALDRSGFAAGTLAPRPGLRAPIPPMDPRPRRSMTDMGMGDMGEGDMAGMDMSAHAPPATKDSMAGMDMPGMDMGSSSSDPGPALERGVSVDNVAAMPKDRTAEPGDGLEDRGLRVLRYSDLRAREAGADPRPPMRELTLHLTGNMRRYIWGFDGKKLSEAEHIRLSYGERVRFVLINDTMMEHPIHLHGLWSELENGQDEFRPSKHTLIVKPGERLSFLVTADEPGLWAFHCHLAYHMDLGMFRVVEVA